MMINISILNLKFRDLCLGLIKQVLDHLHLLCEELHLYELLGVFNLLLFVEELKCLLPHPLSLYCSLIINHQVILCLFLNIHTLANFLKQGIQAIPELIIILQKILLVKEIAASLGCRWAVI